MPRLEKDPRDLRRKYVNVAFSAREWAELNGLMDAVGITSAAVFLRASGLRTKLPRKVILPELHQRLHKTLIAAADDLRKHHDNRTISDASLVGAMESLSQIAAILTDTDSYSRLANKAVEEAQK